MSKEESARNIETSKKSAPKLKVSIESLPVPPREATKEPGLITDPALRKIHKDWFFHSLIRSWKRGNRR